MDTEWPTADSRPVSRQGASSVELDDNAEVKLSAGDTLVQHGAMHAWRNRSDDECVLGCIAFAADRVSP